MTKASGSEAQAVLDRFMELMFKLMMDHHQKQAIEMNLTMSQAQALRALHRGPLCTGALAAELKISAPAATQLMDRLTRKQLIKRRAVDGDRRSVQIMLTDRGKRAIDRFRERRSNICSGALAQLGEEDLQNVAMALGKVILALEGLEVQTASRPGKASNNLSRARKQASVAEE